MAETRRKFDEDFRQGAVRLVRETGKPIAASRVRQREPELAPISREYGLCVLDRPTTRQGHTHEP